MKKTLLPFLLLAACSAPSCGGGDPGVDFEVAVPVSVVEISAGPIEEYVTVTGTARAAQEAVLSVETAGEYRLRDNPATGRPFALGDRVAAGTEIVRIVNEEVENEIRIDAVRLTLETRQIEYEQQQSLFGKGGITRGELKDSERAYVDARYNYENAKLRLARLRVTSPFEGLITALPYYTPGVRVETGAHLVTVQEYSALVLETGLPGRELGRVRAGQAARVMNYTLPEDTLAGRVTQVSPALSEGSRSFSASILIDNPELVLRPGMFVKTEIVVARRDSAIVIPKEVIQVKQRGKTVFIVQRGAAQERVIRTGLENPDFIEVLEGLAAEDRLVVRGFETLRHGSRVRIVQ